MPTLRHLHLGMGLLGVLAFLLTGQYMHWALHHLQGMADGPRLFLRSSHVYLLWSSLLNVALGCYFTGSTRTGCRRIQTLASALVIVGPVLLGLSFFFEPYQPELLRPVGRLGIYGALGGTLGHVVATLWAGAKARGL